MKFVEITPKAKHQREFEDFISNLNFNNAFLENDVIAKREKTSEGSIRLEFNIGNKNYLLADLKDPLEYWISVDIRLYEEQKFFSKTYYGAFIEFIESSKSKPRKFVDCIIPEIQESYQSIELTLNNLVGKYFKYKLPLTSKNIKEIMEITNLRIK
tara:strand:- start:200 stop:667 length:468 start_codon:yes stop_codon:yes gene_type:complete